MQGDAFCGRADDHLPEECPMHIDTLIPAAIPVIADFLANSAFELCTEVAGAC